MLIERQKKKLTAIRRMRKIANRPAKHRALQHSAHASLRAFFPLDLFVDRSVYLPRRPAVSLGFETGQRCPNSRRNDWNQIYLKEREKREMQRTRQSRRARLDETNNARHFCTVLFFLFSQSRRLPSVDAQSSSLGYHHTRSLGVGESVFVNNPYFKED